MARNYPIILSLLLACGLSLPATASSTSSPTPASVVERGKQALQAKDYDTALHNFQEAFMADPTNLDISFYLGQVAFEQGDYETAIMSYERILIMKPDTMRVKLELARCHMRLGSNESAKQYFYEVLASNPPQSVRTNIESLLAAIAASERRHFFSGAVTAGLSFDDNSRSTPASNFPFTSPLTNLTEEVPSSAQSDYFTTESVVLNHIYRLEDSPFSWKTTAVTFNNVYGRYHDLDVNLLGVNSGPTYETTSALFEVHGLFNELLVEHDEYMRPAGIGASAIFALGPKMLANVSSALQTKRYMADSDSVKNASNFTLGVTPILQFGDNRITATLVHEVEKADADYWSYERLSWGLRYDRNLPAHFTAFAGMNVMDTFYEAANPLFGDRRSDTVTDLSCGLTKLLWQSKDNSRIVLAQLSHTYTKSESTITVYQYHKNLTATTITYGF